MRFAKFHLQISRSRANKLFARKFAFRLRNILANFVKVDMFLSYSRMSIVDPCWWSHIVGSIMGTAVAEMATLPICTSKTVYQSNSDFALFGTIRHIYRTRGVFGFYSGSVPAVTAQSISSGMKIGFYKMVVANKLIENYILAGITTALMATIFTHPLDVVRITLQNGGTLKDAPFLYRGWSRSALKGILGGATYLPIRSILMDRFPDTPSWQISIVSSIIGTTIITPIDYLKTVTVAHGLDGCKTELLRCAKSPTRLFKGLSFNLARVVPHFTITMTVCDFVLQAN